MKYFLLGLLMGASAGFLMRSMCHAAKLADERSKKYFDNIKKI